MDNLEHTELINQHLNAQMQQMQLLTERLQALEQENSRLRQPSAETNLPPYLPAAAALREPKVSLPAKFSGIRKDFRGFINQLELVFQLQPTRYVSDNTKIATLGTLLSDQALSWYVPFIEKPELYREQLNSWPAFKSGMAKTFGEIDQTTVSANKLRKLTQGTGMASHYAANFRQLATDLDWNESALINQFRFGLSDAVKDMLVHYDYPTKLNDFVELAIRIDNRLYEHRMERRNGPVHNAQNSGMAPVPTVRNPEAMDVDTLRRGPLTAAEREHRYRNGLCIVCGKPGHLKANCPRTAGKRVASLSLVPENGVSQASKNGQGQ